MKVKIIYTDDLKVGIGGYVKFPLFPLFGLGTPTIRLRKKYIEDEGILNHELKHIEQYGKKWCHAQLYTWNKAYRYKCELEAYTEQIKAYGYNRLNQCDWVIDSLANKYNLNKKTDDIKVDIIKILNKI